MNYHWCDGNIGPNAYPPICLGIGWLIGELRYVSGHSFWQGRYGNKFNNLIFPYYRAAAWAITVKLMSGESHKTSLMKSLHPKTKLTQMYHSIWPHYATMS